MSISESISNEPVAVQTALTTAVTSTLAILLFVGVDPQLVGALTVAASGWLAAGFAIVRSKVTPTKNVALTVDEATALTK